MVTKAKQRPKLLRGACERCYRYKEKCTFDDLQKSCFRCSDLGEQCRPRPRKRMGRRPVIHQHSSGLVYVMRLDAGYQDWEMDSNANIGAALPPSYSNILTMIDDKSGPSTARSIPSKLPGPQPSLRGISRLFEVLGTTEAFFEVHRNFMLGKSFVPGFQSTVKRLFARCPHLLADAYSVAMKSMHTRHAVSVCLDSSDFEIGARCLKNLMDSPMPISHVEDAAATVLLGQAMLVYNTLIPSKATHVITRATLLATKHWYPEFLSKPYLDTVTLTPVIMDTVECLIRREVPIIQIATPNRCIVDRFVGVCSSLLPLLYELCLRSWEAKIDPLVKEIVYGTSVEHDRYTEIERKIKNWAPDLPPRFLTEYSALEVSFMLAQARCYRSAAMLVIHRLRFPLGIENDIAKLLAEGIFCELSILKIWPPPAATGLGLDFPLLMATLELPEQGAKFYAAFEPIRFRRQHSDELLEFVNLVTEAKNNGYRGLWFELAHDRLHGVTLT